jgi:hypothetical protein
MGVSSPYVARNMFFSVIVTDSILYKLLLRSVLRRFGPFLFGLSFNF